MTIAGVDEVGRGPLAGPVLAAAVVLQRPVEGLADSKSLAAARREALFAVLLRHAFVGVGAASVQEIDRLNILQASLLAMRRAVARLPGSAPDLVLVDGRQAPDLACRVRTIVGGDREVPEIAAASIVAKVIRDRVMHQLADRHPGYGWETNVGYATDAHRAALRRLGACRHHRRSFRPVRETFPLPLLPAAEAGVVVAAEDHPNAVQAVALIG
ncbi:MAG: ribonuclease HII [Geminicoccaceae bacterium]|nr:ribonuclease HII [Geminicoccaceae bacterium]